MRVLMTDLAPLSEKKLSGVGHYTQELTRALRELQGPDFVYSFPKPWLTWREDWVNAQSRRFEVVARRPGLLAWAEKKVRGKVLSVVRRYSPLMQNPYRVAIERSGCGVYHEPNFIPRDLDLPTVVSVHDVSALLHPEWHPPERVAFYQKYFHRGLTRADRLIAISEFGKAEIVRHLGVPAEKVSVTYMGVRPGLRRVEGEGLARGLGALGLREGYLLHVGTLEPRKNVLMLLKAYCSLPSEVREKHPLVLAGGKGWNSGEVHAYLQAEAKGKNVRWLGYVAEKHFPALYSGARALVFPTRYEGFGMPTIEMMACGGAVLASTAGAVAETVGTQAHLIDPHDADGWRDALLRACTDGEWIKTLRAGAEQAAAPFTWRRCAEQTLDAYRRTA